MFYIDVPYVDTSNSEMSSSGPLPFTWRFHFDWLVSTRPALLKPLKSKLDYTLITKKKFDSVFRIGYLATIIEFDTNTDPWCNLIGLRVVWKS